MMEVEFDILNMEGWISSVATKNRCSIKVLECIPWNGEGGQARFCVRTGDRQKVLHDISIHPDITGMESEVLADDSVIGSVAMKNCSLIRTILSSGCFLESAISEGDGAVRMKISTGSGGSIPSLMAKMNEMGLLVNIRRMSHKVPEARLSKTQEDIVRMALQDGYFDIPRRISTKELAKKCQIAPSTLREILTRAEKNALTALLKDGTDRF